MHIFFLLQHKEETDTQLFLALNSPVPSFLLFFPPSPILRVLSHTITKYQALPSPISCMLEELHLSSGPGIRTHRQLPLVPQFVSYTFGISGFDWYFSQ